MEGPNSNRRTLQRQLPSAIQVHILSVLPPNEQALSGRFVCPEASSALCSTASLSQPLPPYALSWAQEAWQHNMRQLPFDGKLQLLCTAAASGSTANLEVAWALVRAGTFAEVLRTEGSTGGCPGMAAAKAGHAHVLPWLVQRCPALLSPNMVLLCAAQYCDLAGLQSAWEVLQDAHSRNTLVRPPKIEHWTVIAAAKSETPDAVAKIEWLQAQVGDVQSYGQWLVEPAMSAGQLDTVRWLLDDGCEYHTTSVLQHALEHAGLDVAQWLVEDDVCSLPDEDSEEGAWDTLLWAAARSADGVAKLQWLRENGAPPLDSARGLPGLLCLGAGEGPVEVMRYLLDVCGPAAVLQAGSGSGNRDLRKVVARSGSVPMAECLRQAGMEFRPMAYLHAAGGGHLGLVRWLALEAGVSAAGLSRRELDYIAAHWPGSDTAAGSPVLLEAVQLLVGAGFCRWGEEEEEEEGVAGDGGDDDICWLFVKGDLVATAIERTDLALLRYLLQQQPEYKLGWSALVRAAKVGCEAMLEWLVQQPGCADPLRDDPASPYLAAAENGDRATLEALRRLGVLWGAEDVVARAVASRGCRVPALRWLVEQGAPVGIRADLEEAVAERLESFPSMKPEDVAWLKSLVSCQPHGPGHA